ncbi:hypothetical protein MKEN_00824200 [Mycena kentingensis (nom. inval.)]|nr:hypothetical protein MKEN_00824200 [Mycena kentingensis (nom. inval.)]
MKHGVAFRKLSRTTSHRILMLRNLVTSLFEHEQIKTTLPKAREAARFAEKIITLGKKGDRGSYARASALLLKPELLPKLFSTFSERYASRPGGYTRIHKFGNRPGDNAPHAVLELVDNPRDIRWEMTTRAVGWDLLREKLKTKKPASIINAGMEDALEVVAKEQNYAPEQQGVLRPTTRRNLQKVLRYRTPEAVTTMSQKAGSYVDHLLATPVAFRTIEQEDREEVAETRQRIRDEFKKPPAERNPMVYEGVSQKNPPRRPPRPGQALPGETRGTLDLARGALGNRRLPTPPRLLTTPSVFSRRHQPKA